MSVRAPASTATTLRAEQPHPLHVGLLAADVLLAHVDDALEAEQRAGGGGGDAVLAGAGLGDDPRLAHALGEQRLAERVVELVRAGVVEVLALEQIGRPARSLRRRASYSGVGRPAKSRSSSASSARKSAAAQASTHARSSSLERRHQRLGHVLAAVGAVAVRDRTHAATVSAAVEEGPHALGILDPRRSLDAACDVDGERVGRRDRGRHALGVEPAADDQRQLRAASGQQRPVEALARAAAQPRRAAVEQVEVGVEALEVAHREQARAPTPP